MKPTIGRTLTVFGVMTASAAMLIPTAAPAAKASASGGGGKKGGGSSSLALVMVVDNNRDGRANYNDTVSFQVSTTQTQYPTVDLRCYQNGALVYSAGAGFYASYPWPWARNMTLASGTWTGGAASCTATLSGSSVLATLDFVAGA
jgi:hypothetical protein